MKFKKYFVEGIPRRKFLEASLKGGIALATPPSLMMQLLSCKGGEKEIAKLTVAPQVLDRVVQKALEKGGEFADVYLENRVSREILMEESKVKPQRPGIGWPPCGQSPIPLGVLYHGALS